MSEDLFFSDEEQRLVSLDFFKGSDDWSNQLLTNSGILELTFT